MKSLLYKIEHENSWDYGNLWFVLKRDSYFFWLTWKVISVQTNEKDAKQSLSRELKNENN